MASILDEYEDSLYRSASVQQSRASVGIPHSGYVNARLEKETPIFNKQRIDFTPPEKINSLVVSSNQLCMSLGKDTLLRIDLGKPDEPNQVELGRKDEAKVYKMFLDHTDSLLSYLEQAGTNPNRIHYDLKYALRLCAEHGHHHACVHIYKVMELYEEAVDLALQVDVDLAKSCADLPEDDEELRKKLWLKIARHVVQEEKDVKKAMACLSSCALLKIEDVLPFFPDFVTIDHFKEAICNSLEDYNKHIEELKREMEEATQSAKRIREDIQEMRNKYGSVEPQEKCAACDFPLLNRPFYLFLCGHMFHYDCLLQAVFPNLPAYKQAKLEDLQKKLAATSQPSKGHHRPKDADTASLGKGQQSREQIKADIDDIVAAECVYCGELMIRSIDKPFIDPQKYEEEMQSWL